MATTLDNFFIEGDAGRLMVVRFAPAGDAGGRAVLHLPAFGDEMNRARRMVALTARTLAERGVTVLCLDPFGTGDSDGEFRDASWETWLADAAHAIRWLLGAGYSSVELWGLRTGALLACEVATWLPGFTPERVLLWQPVLNGEQFLMQFLRLISAGGLVRGGERPTAADLRAAIAAGECVEVGGYAITGALWSTLASRKLMTLDLSPGSAVTWCDVSAVPQAAASPAAAAVLAAWRERGVQVEHDTVSGVPFWVSQNVAIAPELIERSTIALGTPQ